MENEYFYDELPKGRWWDFDKKLKMIDTSVEHGAICLDKKPLSNTLYIKPFTYIFEMLLNALRLLQNRPLPHHLPLLKLFETNMTHIDWSNFNLKDIEKLYFLDMKRSGALIQKEFVKIALSTTDFAILNGPPGTGKTQVICEIIIQEIMKGNKVILVASTNVAVDNVLERMMGLEAAEDILFPIRIGNEKTISKNNLLKYSYGQIKRTEKERILKRLRGLRKRTSAQDLLYEAMITNSKKSIIDDTILDAANLICGTTIGILQFPPIKRLKNQMQKPLFDVMILDEASKTPFHEFLVPAIWAKKWILTGDPKQLSPYVESEDVEVCLDAVAYESDISIDEKKASLILLDAVKPNKNHLSIVVTDDITHPIYQNIVSNLDNKMDKDTKKLRILDTNEIVKFEKYVISHFIFSSHVILCNINHISKLKDQLPGKLKIWIHMGNENMSPIEVIKKFPRELLSKVMFSSLKNQNKNIFNTVVEDNWAHELGYRLSRKFELRKDPKRANYLDEDIKYLTSFEKIEQNLTHVRKVFFPSVLESLLEGFDRKGDNKFGNTLTDGLPESAKKIRFRLLEFQHRMHSQISDFPRKFIYDNKSLLNAENIDRLRSNWYDKYKVRAKWIEVSRDNNEMIKIKNGMIEPTFNLNEVKVIKEELSEFENWTKLHRKPNGEKWTVAILTYYRDQEKKLRSMLQRLFSKKSRWRTFERLNMKVELCTVDRFQGHEADLVFLSFVNNTRTGFLDVPNRLNVAITRARYQLILIGKRKYFSQCKSKILRDLANQITSDRRY